MTDPTPSAIEARESDHAIADLENEARGYLLASRSPNTVRAYASDWRAFST